MLKGGPGGHADGVHHYHAEVGGGAPTSRAENDKKVKY